MPIINISVICIITIKLYCSNGRRKRKDKPWGDMWRNAVVPPAGVGERISRFHQNGSVDLDVIFCQLITGDIRFPRKILIERLNAWLCVEIRKSDGHFGLQGRGKKRRTTSTQDNQFLLLRLIFTFACFIYIYICAPQNPKSDSNILKSSGEWSSLFLLSFKLKQKVKVQISPSNLATRTLWFRSYRTMLLFSIIPMAKWKLPRAINSYLNIMWR